MTEEEWIESKQPGEAGKILDGYKEPVPTSEEIVPLQRVGRPRRGAPIGLMGLVAMTAAIGGTCGLPRRLAEEKPHEPTKYDSERVREAALKRQRRAAKKAENQRRANEGKRPTMRTERETERAKTQPKD